MDDGLSFEQFLAMLGTSMADLESGEASEDDIRQAMSHLFSSQPSMGEGPYDYCEGCEFYAHCWGEEED